MYRISDRAKLAEFIKALVVIAQGDEVVRVFPSPVDLLRP